MKSIRSSVSRQASALPTPLLAAALALGLVGFSGGGALSQGRTTTPTPTVDISKEAGARQFEELDPKNFDRSEDIDHPYWPLKPGMRWTYEGYTIEDGKRTPHRIVFTVTDLVKEIAGVRTRVIHDADYSDGKLVEEENTFFAQDKLGNVWHLGQYLEIYEDGFLVGGKHWNIGNPVGAKAGIMMPADPRPGTPSYSEGYAPSPFNWTDRGRVYQTGQKNKVPAGSYDDVLVIEEFDAEKPGAFQLKYYARGVGNIRVGSRGRENVQRESLELVKVGRLSAEDLAADRAGALALERRATMYPSQPLMQHVPIPE